MKNGFSKNKYYQTYVFVKKVFCRKTFAAQKLLLHLHTQKKTPFVRPCPGGGIGRRVGLKHQ